MVGGGNTTDGARGVKGGREAVWNMLEQEEGEGLMGVAIGIR